MSKHPHAAAYIGNGGTGLAGLSKGKHALEIKILYFHAYQSRCVSIRRICPVTTYQAETLATLSSAFGSAPFTAWEAADAIDSVYGNTYSTLRSLRKSGTIAESNGTFTINA